MTLDSELQIVDVPAGGREALDEILEQSFEGWYLQHAKRTLRRIDIVRAAQMKDTNIGLVMLTWLGGDLGYIYYIAVAPDHRKRKVGSRLLDDSLGYFFKNGSKAVYASISSDNPESENLFMSKGFSETNFGALSKEYGFGQALNLYRKMLVVPGEKLLQRGRER